MKIIIATTKSWNINNCKKFKNVYCNQFDIFLIDSPEILTVGYVKSIEPDYIFFPHWSWLITKEIYENYKCIVFHMTDLPFGRGGSPLQNLIERGIEETKVTAIKVTETLDAGDIYLKRALNLNGSADEIYNRASKLIFFDMIPEIINKTIAPLKQLGEITVFKRRTPDQSLIMDTVNGLEIFYDQIRMLDGEGYPRAFIKYGKYKLEFSRAKFNGQKIIADVKITEDDDE